MVVVIVVVVGSCSSRSSNSIRSNTSSRSISVSSSGSYSSRLPYCTCEGSDPYTGMISPHIPAIRCEWIGDTCQKVQREHRHPTHTYIHKYIRTYRTMETMKYIRTTFLVRAE